VRTILFDPKRFWTTCTKFDNCCLRYHHADFFYMGLHIYILGPKALDWVWQIKSSCSHLSLCCYIKRRK